MDHTTPNWLSDVNLASRKSLHLVGGAKMKESIADRSLGWIIGEGVP